jgi:hypothetical protein
MNVMNLLSSCTMGPGWKISSRSLWCCISLLRICWCRCSITPLKCFGCFFMEYSPEFRWTSLSLSRESNRDWYLLKPDRK